MLAALGGFDIAGLCGVFLGGALEKIPVIMDGFISGVAALCAVRLCPAAAKAVFASHASSEPAARLVLNALHKKPLITADLHLGEGTGAVASLPLWNMALAVYNHCYSFHGGRGIGRRTPRNADADHRRCGQRQKRLCGVSLPACPGCPAPTLPRCRCGWPSAPPALPNTAPCGPKSSSTR